MKRVVLIFDYFKRAFSLNKTNKALYQPQIALILLKTCLLIIYAIILYKIMVSMGNASFSFEVLWDIILKSTGWLIIVIILQSLASIVVEAGLYNMYKSCILNEHVESGVFQEGVMKYFFRFLSADMLMILIWIILLIPYIIIGILTLAAGFVIIPLLFVVFTTMWKVIIVMEEAKLFESLQRSINFAKVNFLPLSVLVIIQKAFSALAGGGSGGSASSNVGTWRQSANSGQTTTKITDAFENTKLSFEQWYPDFLSYFKTGLYIAIPVISIAVIVSSLVKMVFKIFFSLSVFVMYFENKTYNNPVMSKEVL